MTAYSITALAILAVFAAIAICGGSIQARIHPDDDHPGFDDIKEQQ